MASSIENLREMRTRLGGIYEHLPRFGLSADRPPILDALESDGGNAEDTNINDINEEDDASATASSSGKNSPGGGGGGGTTTKDTDVLRQPSASDGIPGLRVFRESVRHDIEQIDKFLARHAARGTSTSTTTFSTNAPYLIAVWNELIRAPPPVLFVDKTFPAPSEKKPPPPLSKMFSKKSATGAKVDMVADNGRRWIRINTIKNSRLLAELRELDSYLTESESEGEEEECSRAGADCTCAISCGAKSAREELDNSLLQMGKALASAAQSSLSAYSGDGEDMPPKVTLRLTRLLLSAESLLQLEGLGLKIIGPRQCSIASDPSETDPRIAQTIYELLKMGLEIELGEHGFAIPPELLSTFVKTRRRRLIPSRQINLDLSVLIALVSDLTHAALPASTEEAYVRYIPTPAERARSRRRRQQQKALLAQAKAASEGAAATPAKKKEKENTGNSAPPPAISKEAAAVDGGGGNSESDDEGESVHSRALANQVLREMDVALLDEIVGRLEVRDDGAIVEFWASREVRERCLRIVDKIGGPAEKRRASALLLDRRAPNEPVLGIQYASIDEAADAYWRDSRHPRDAMPTLAPLHVFEDESDDDLQQQTGTAGVNQTALKINPFWIDLERACLRLLSEGSTSHPRVLCKARDTQADSADEGGNSNSIERASVTRGNPRLTAHTVSTLGHGAVRHWTTLTANRASVRKMLKESAKEAGRASSGLGLEACDEEEEAEAEAAAIWIVEPRSLAESMRGDFVP